MKKRIGFYVDGSYNKEMNSYKWAVIRVENDKITNEWWGERNATGKADVEWAESDAIMFACNQATFNNNYIIYTDSKSVIDKVTKRVPNATKNPNIAGIRNMLNCYKRSVLPISLEFQHMKRCSNSFMKRVDKLMRSC